ncbi:lipopolysaccharide biosynthesis protein [Roseivirga sp.]|uniref:lipopolysaccharide biosynthesis protein n=1 Tax=Roseivirga sp. TaxID=1964215 RepID=UPI003B8B329A
MFDRIKKSKYLQHSVFSFGGQVAFLLSNFLLFILLVNKISQDLYGAWALYMTIISIADSLRQGMVNNGLARLLVKSPNDKTLSSTGFCLNYGLILTLGLIGLLASFVVAQTSTIQELLPHAWKSLLMLGTMQFISTLCQAKFKFKAYLVTNLIYLTCLIAAIIYVSQTSETITLIQVINAQAVSLILPALYFLIQSDLSLVLPTRIQFKRLLDFGRFAAGTNMLSILFHKADILMIAFFLDPVSVAIFHFATKIMNYAELPLHALSQVIYPRLSASYHANKANELNKEYGLAIIRLLVFVIPIVIAVVMLNKTIINILSSGEYIDSSQLIIILGLGIIFKPWGRVFGLTLDAIGKPKVNFNMLLISLIINISVNLILIPLYGVRGAAIATTLSIIITTIIGQFRIGRYASIKPIEDVWLAIRNQQSHFKSFSWN